MASHDDGVGFPQGIPGLSVPTDPLEVILGPFPCARLRNIPFDATVEDILVLFQGLVVIDVLLVEPGEAFVLFANPMDYQMGLQRDRQGIGRNMVEITPSSRSEYYKAIGAREQWQEAARRPILSIGQHGIHRGPDGSEILDGTDVSAMWSSSGTATGTPLHSLNASAGDIGQRRGGGGVGMGSSKGGSIGSGSAASGRSGPSHMVKRTGGGIQVGEHTGFLRMRGLPFSSTKDDIYRFFEGYNPVVDSVVLTYRSDGRATGEAYIGFESPDDSKRAMELHRKTMGSRYIELFLSNKDEHGRALARFGNR